MNLSKTAIPHAIKAIQKAYPDMSGLSTHLAEDVAQAIVDAEVRGYKRRLDEEDNASGVKFYYVVHTGGCLITYSEQSEFPLMDITRTLRAPPLDPNAYIYSWREISMRQFKTHFIGHGGNWSVVKEALDQIHRSKSPGVTHASFASQDRGTDEL